MHASNLYENLGGKAACRKLSETFYARVALDPVLRPLFPGKTMTCAIEEFAAFLAQFLGGPGEDSQRRWWLSLHESHLRFKIGPKERSAWLANMTLALDQAQIDEPVRRELLNFFQRSSAYVVNQSEISTNELQPASAEISRRWDAQLALDQAVAAIRSGDSKRAIELAEVCDQPALSGLLALILRSGQPVLLAYLREKIAGDPAISKQRYAGRTLLLEAAAVGNLSIVELLLSLGADPNAHDGGKHTPLYSLANECAVEGAAKVVRALVTAGADVNAHDGVKRCTPLHMAARRGNVEVAESLLDCGAEMEARDSLGETPLRRSVNCDKAGVAAMLLTRGADAHSIGSKGATPGSAARTIAMKRLFESYLRGEPISG